MNAYEAAAQYRQMGARGAHPVGLVVRLYDALLEDFRRAGEAVAQKDIERRIAALNHALLILAELEGTLDLERGAQVARYLQGLYRISRSLIMEANLHASSARLERLASLFLPVRQAWRQAERELCQGPSGGAAAPQRETPRETIAAEAGEPLSGARSWSV